MSGHNVSAANAYRRACVIYQMASVFARRRMRRRWRRFAPASIAFKRYAKLVTDVQIESVEVPYHSGSLPAYFVHAKNTSSARNPCVVFFDGLDVTKELQYSRGVEDWSDAACPAWSWTGPARAKPSLPRLLFAPRLRGRRQRLHRLSGAARRRRCRAYRGDGDQLGRLLRPALRFHGAALRCLCRLGRDMGLLRHVEASNRRRLQDSLSVPGHHIMWILGVDSLDAALKTSKRTGSTECAKDALPLAHHPRCG